QLPALLDKLSDFLLADRDAANGRPIIANVYRGQDIYHGPLSGRAADLIIEYTNFYDPQQAQPAPNPHVEGGHTPDGILLAHGPQIATAPAISGATLMDLAPTVLYLLDQPIPPDMDGRALTELIQPNHLAQHPPRPAATPARLDEGEMLPEPAGYRPEEEAEIEDQLRQLGYID